MNYKGDFVNKFINFSDPEYQTDLYPINDLSLTNNIFINGNYPDYVNGVSSISILKNKNGHTIILLSDLHKIGEGCVNTENTIYIPRLVELIIKCNPFIKIDLYTESLYLKKEEGNQKEEK